MSDLPGTSQCYTDRVQTEKDVYEPTAQLAQVGLKNQDWTCLLLVCLKMNYCSNDFLVKHLQKVVIRGATGKNSKP